MRTALGIALLALCGCMNPNTGSSTTVGEEFALPEITDSSDSVKIRVFQKIKGARVWTAKDSRVTVNYRNAYTNEYFGILRNWDSTELKVEVEPMQVGTEQTEDN